MRVAVASRPTRLGSCARVAPSCGLWFSAAWTGDVPAGVVPSQKRRDRGSLRGPFVFIEGPFGGSLRACERRLDDGRAGRRAGASGGSARRSWHSRSCGTPRSSVRAEVEWLSRPLAPGEALQGEGAAAVQPDLVLVPAAELVAAVVIDASALGYAMPVPRSKK